MIRAFYLEKFTGSVEEEGGEELNTYSSIYGVRQNGFVGFATLSTVFGPFSSNGG